MTPLLHPVLILMHGVFSVTGVLAGWQFTQGFRSSNLAQLRAHQAKAVAERARLNSPNAGGP